MLSTKDMKKEVLGLLPDNGDASCVVGNGLFAGVSLAFDKEKLEGKKREIASYLKEIGVDELPLVKLSNLTKLKDGSSWNNLNNIEDFQALELLVAVSDASGFIVNNNTVRQMNIHEVGEINSLLLTQAGKALCSDDSMWLDAIKDTILDHMYFITDAEAIRLNAPEDPAKGPVRSRKPGRR